MMKQFEKRIGKLETKLAVEAREPIQIVRTVVKPSANGPVVVSRWERRK